MVVVVVVMIDAGADGRLLRAVAVAVAIAVVRGRRLGGGRAEQFLPALLVLALFLLAVSGGLGLSFRQRQFFGFDLFLVFRRLLVRATGTVIVVVVRVRVSTSVEV